MTANFLIPLFAPALRSLAVVFATFLFMAAGRADPVSDFYHGRTVSLISGFTPNGENDIQLRLLARHIGRFIPGQPQVVIVNMPGAGTLLAANQLQKAAADGTVLVNFTSQAAVEPFLGNTAAVFNPLKLDGNGSM